jgi:hypothetical protein
VSFLLAYLRLYARCLALGLQGIAKNAWTLVLPMGLFVAYLLLLGPVSLLGPLAGMFMRLALYLAFSSYLYFAAGTVANQKVDLSDLKKSFVTYFWSLMGLFFVLWIVEIILGAVLGQNPNRAVILRGVDLIAFIVLNPAPEIIYLKGTRGGMDTISNCVKFIQENWIEWFIPNLLVGFAGYLVFSRLELLPLPVTIVLALVGGALFHVLMVFRGHLFQALDGSTHRQRMFKYGKKNVTG